MLTPSQVDQIEQRVAAGAERVFVMEVDGEKLVIKGQEPSRGQWRLRLLRWSSVLLREPLLVPAYVPGGVEAQAIEVSRLTRLKEGRAAVPALRHVTPNWIAIDYAGSHNLIQVMDAKEKAPSYYWDKALAAILQTHQKGQNLSQAFARNVMYDNGEIYFIDFEDDPELAMGAINARARDWAFFVYSTAWRLEIDKVQAAHILLTYLKQDDPEVLAAVDHVAKSVGWLRRLPKNRDPWGRDVIAMQRFAALLHEMRSQLKAG